MEKEGSFSNLHLGNAVFVKPEGWQIKTGANGAKMFGRTVSILL